MIATAECVTHEPIAGCAAGSVHSGATVPGLHRLTPVRRSPDVKDQLSLGVNRLNRLW